MEWEIVTLVAIWQVNHWIRRPWLVGFMAQVTFALAATNLLLLLHAPAGWVVFLLRACQNPGPR